MLPSASKPVNRSFEGCPGATPSAGNQIIGMHNDVRQRLSAGGGLTTKLTTTGEHASRSVIVSPPRRISLVEPCRSLLTAFDTAHDEAVFAAYGWKPDMTGEEILEKLLALNLERVSG